MLRGRVRPSLFTRQAMANAIGPNGVGGQVGMSRYERRIFFEALVQLRERYWNLGEEDAMSCISVGAAPRG
jgi:hypothetical protein